MGELRVECFHRVLPFELRQQHWPYFARGTAMTVEAFDQRLSELGEDYDFVDEQQVAAILDGTVSPGRACWITFDDGYADALTWAAPVAARYDVRPSIFITTRVLEGDWLPPVDRWYALLSAAEASRFGVSIEGQEEIWDLRTKMGRARAVTGELKTSFLEASHGEQKQQLRTLAASLGVSDVPRPAASFLSRADLEELSSLGWYVGPHGHEHRLLPRLERDALVQEIQRSVQSLETLALEHRSRWFAYSDGRYSDAVRREARRLLSRVGFHGALTIDGTLVSQAADPWAVPRFIA